MYTIAGPYLKIDPDALNWVKSPRSATGHEACVEVAPIPGKPGAYAIRNSNTPGVVITYNVKEIRAFVESVRAGEIFADV